MSKEHEEIPRDLEHSDFDAPVRICCGQRHFDAVCPDGKVMCCLCFSRFGLAGLADADDGRKQDVCKTCAAEEAAEMERRKPQ